MPQLRSPKPSLELPMYSPSASPYLPDSEKPSTPPPPYHRPSQKRSRLPIICIFASLPLLLLGYTIFASSYPSSTTSTTSTAATPATSPTSYASSLPSIIPAHVDETTLTSLSTKPLHPHLSPRMWEHFWDEPAKQETGNQMESEEDWWERDIYRDGYGEEAERLRIEAEGRERQKARHPEENGGGGGGKGATNNPNAGGNTAPGTTPGSNILRGDVKRKRLARRGTGRMEGRSGCGGGSGSGGGGGGGHGGGGGGCGGGGGGGGHGGGHGGGGGGYGGGGEGGGTHNWEKLEFNLFGGGEDEGDGVMMQQSSEYYERDYEEDGNEEEDESGSSRSTRSGSDDN